MGSSFFLYEGKMNRKLTRVKKGVTYEVPLFPMDVMNITQGCNGYFSHSGANAIDCAGRDTGKDPIFAPVTMRYVAHDTEINGNAIYFESVNPVLFADGTIDYLTLMFIHDDYIGDVLNLASQGYIFVQGEEVLDEGMAGYVTGPHSHIEGAKGPFLKRANVKLSMYEKTNGSVWHLPESISPDKIFVIDGITLYNRGQPPAGLGNTMYWKKADEIPGIVNATGFCDVPENAYFSNSIKEAKQLGLITGSDGVFRPYDPIKRGDLCTILHRLKGSPKVNQINPFIDVASNDYFYMPVMWATLQGITAGTGQRFRPKDTATRAEAITFLYRLCGSPKQEDTELTFTDVPEDIYYRKPVEWGVRNNIINGKSQDKFDPYAECSRADFVVMLMRTYRRKK